KTLFGGPLMVSDYVLNRRFRIGRTELNRDHTRPDLCRHASYSSRGPCSFTSSSIRLLRVVTRQMQPQSNTGVIHAHTPNPSPHSSPSLGACAVLSLFAPLRSPTAAAAQPPAELYEGHVQVDRGQADDPETFTGQVFDDVNENSKLDGDEQGVAGVAVTNGVDVVQTDGEGRYELPVRDNMTVSITQPAGWQVPVDEDKVAQFSYN